LAKVHSDHLKKVGIGCNLSFSILIDDQIWGLIFCQNVRPTRINLIKREAFVYMIQWASTSFADEQLVQEREFNERIRNFELLLKEKLLLKKVGIGCNLSFSILIDDQIWGLIFCQNVRPTRINLIKREAFVYMIQWASTRFADEQLVQEREFNERIRNFELLLKEKLLLK